VRVTKLTRILAEPEPIPPVGLAGEVPPEDPHHAGG
jgi:hypothetical protein